MDQERIGKVIKELRTKSNLSQQKFALKYGVSYQAVSKWETGKNMPDIIILKQICNDYDINLDDLLTGHNKEKKINKMWIISIILILITAICVTSIVLLKNNKPFEFKTLSTSCSDFNLFGSIAYNDSKTSIYISNITYCGGDDTSQYKKIECKLFEVDGKITNEISSYNYNEKKEITLEEFLKDIKFNVDHYEQNCKIYKENSLHLEIEATSKDNKITKYNIPLKLEDNCIN